MKSSNDSNIHIGAHLMYIACRSLRRQASSYAPFFIWCVLPSIRTFRQDQRCSRFLGSGLLGGFQKLNFLMSHPLRFIIPHRVHEPRLLGNTYSSSMLLIIIHQAMRENGEPRTKHLPFNL